jgi:hypothetical protein
MGKQINHVSGSRQRTKSAQKIEQIIGLFACKLSKLAQNVNNCNF